MTHIQEAVNRSDAEPKLAHLSIGGLTLRDTHVTRRPQEHVYEYRIPEGIELELPDSYPIAHLSFPDGVIDMDMLREMTMNATSFSIPPEITICITFNHNSNHRIDASDPVTAQLLSFYAETHPGKFTITQTLERPSVFFETYPVAKEEVIIDHPTTFGLT
jgi:hypothetical protein